MSKVVVYVLDKIVWMLLITALTTQALQIAGIVDTPKSLGDISYKQDNEYNFQVRVGSSGVRGKRQADHTSQFFNNLFNIPISTLNAVNNLVQSTRPAFQFLRDQAFKRLEKSRRASESIVNNSTQTRLYPVYIPNA